MINPICNKHFTYPPRLGISEGSAKRDPKRVREDSVFSRWIRLYTAAESKSLNNPIQCAFYTAKIKPCLEEQYIAVSYAWGQPTLSQSISIDGQPFRVHANLYTFLRCYQSQIREPVLLWIDAICIDQNSVQERNAQVAYMDLIYRDGESVISWLGPLEALIGLPEPVGHREPAGETQLITEKLRATMSGVPAEQVSTGLREIAQNIVHYFSRMWICQELALAKRVVFYCGTHQFSRKDLWNLLEPVDKNFPSKISLQLAVREAVRNIEVATQGRLSLCQLVHEFKMRDCKVLHDRIYALRGMAADVRMLHGMEWVPHYMDVDYGEPFVYTMLRAIDCDTELDANKVLVGQQIYADLLEHLSTGAYPKSSRPPDLHLFLKGGFRSEVACTSRGSPQDLRVFPQSTYETIQTSESGARHDFVPTGAHYSSKNL